MLAALAYAFLLRWSHKRRERASAGQVTAAGAAYSRALAQAQVVEGRWPD